jgi:hypothetical protein
LHISAAKQNLHRRGIISDREYLIRLVEVTARASANSFQSEHPPSLLLMELRPTRCKSLGVVIRHRSSAVADPPRTIAIIETNDAGERQNTTRTLIML